MNAVIKALASLALAALSVSASSAADAPVPDPAALYQQHCAACHGATRTGGMGPALFPENLERLRRPQAADVLKNGRVATQMPPFANLLDDSEREALLDYIYRAPAEPVRFSEQEIRASRIVHVDKELPAKPVFKADWRNVFLVVEGGDHHVSVVDGDRFEVIHRFASRFALHGGPKFTSDGRYVYFGSRDGWVSKYDLWNLTMVAEVRASLNLRNVAVAADGKTVVAGNYLPQTVTLFDADLNLLQVIDAKDTEGAASRVSAVYDAAPRSSFVVALKDSPEVWEIPWQRQSDGSFSVQRMPLSLVLDDFFFDPEYKHLIGAARDGRAQVIDLDRRQAVAELPLGGMPHLGAGVSFMHEGERVFVSPDLKSGQLNLIRMRDWTRIKTIATPGPGFFVRSHEDTPYLWTDSMMSPNKDTLTLVDKRTLEIAKQIRTDPGKTLAHIEFTKDGRYALASLWEDAGALIVFDAHTFAEVKRLPMRKPIGKYNVHNKITRSEGTSH